MYRLLKNILFLIPAEKAHTLTMYLLKLSFKIPFVKNIVLKPIQGKFKKNPEKIMGNHISQSRRISCWV